MASVTKKDIPQESAMMGDLWELIKKYYIPEDSDEYWINAWAAISALRDKYPSELCRQLGLAFWNYLGVKEQAMKNTADHLHCQFRHPGGYIGRARSHE